MSSAAGASTSHHGSNSMEVPAPLLPLLSILSSLFLNLSSVFHRIPGSPIILRYIKSSYQDDPYRSLLEVLLVAFAIRTIFKGRTGGEGQGKSFIKFSEKEIDELVDEWRPAPLVEELEESDIQTLSSVPTIHGPGGTHVKLSAGGKSVLNLASIDWLGLVEADQMKQTAIDTLKEYGVGTCGPAGFYGLLDVHLRFQSEVAEFLGTEDAIVYSQAYATTASVIPAFAKRGDIIVADRGVNFAIQRGLQISRSQIRWYAHGDMEDMERVMQQVEKERKRKGGKLTKKFIVTEGIFENDGMMVDLPKVIELKHKYKYRLMLDESHSFGMIGAHGKGVTEHYNIPASEVDMLIASMANGCAAGGGFCAGSSVVCSHQRINSSASVFSASLPAMLATTASTALTVFNNQPELFNALQANSLLFRQILNKLEPTPFSVPPCDPAYITPSESMPPPAVTNNEALIHIPSHPQSALIHIFLLNPPSTLQEEEAMLQDIVDETLNTSQVLVTRARRLRGQEGLEPEPSLKICMSSNFTKKEVEKAAQALKQAITKVCSKRR
ncbi:putative serine C-palmitoyltransferase [Kockovaella imperatae]|uniref:serine C-palmitoyltransferase n=1 Tax=Kockovaella imperatae TaxID=4999 RepID=A0A1Y1UT52_9TREE|nr:putative serine C-palmitoyltransferase [Kockovaella imperatae]ORX41190.1 putative serine C-palmitoyltransferase [Kockovaella imperatae]